VFFGSKEYDPMPFRRATPPKAALFTIIRFFLDSFCL